MLMKNPNSVVSGGAGALLLGLLLFPAGPALAQNFDVGSTGALGDVVIAENTTLDLPADGKLHYKSLTVNAGVRLKFNRNVRNTPVFILSQGDVVVNGIIDVNGFTAANNNDGGRGGPGGFDGGKPGFSDTAPGSGYGPGGAGGGTGNCGGANDAAGGSFGSQGAGPQAGQAYGNSFLIPLIGGSGGGGSTGSPGLGGGGGGGAVLIAANTRIEVTGTLEARGGANRSCVNGGSGGGIRLVAPKVEGGGLLDARAGGGGGSGRIRVDTIDRSGVQFNFQGVSSVGGNLFTFPPVVPRLDTIEVAGNVLPEGSAPATFTLPFGSTPSRTVKIQARDFGRNVPIRVTLTPDAGAPVVVDAEVDNTTTNPAVIEVPVTVPINTLVTVHCWTR